MLQAEGGGHLRDDEQRPSTLVGWRVASGASRTESESGDLEDAEFVSSTPAVPEGSRIRKEAFSPNYFQTFFVEERELGRGGKGVVLLVRHQIDGCHLGTLKYARVYGQF